MATPRSFPAFSERFFCVAFTAAFAFIMPAHAAPAPAAQPVPRGKAFAAALLNATAQPPADAAQTAPALPRAAPFVASAAARPRPLGDAAALQAAGQEQGQGAAAGALLPDASTTVLKDPLVPEPRNPIPPAHAAPPAGTVPAAPVAVARATPPPAIGRAAPIATQPGRDAANAVPTPVVASLPPAQDATHPKSCSLADMQSSPDPRTAAQKPGPAQASTPTPANTHAPAKQRAPIAPIAQTLPSSPVAALSVPVGNVAPKSASQAVATPAPASTAPAFHGSEPAAIDLGRAAQPHEAAISGAGAAIVPSAPAKPYPPTIPALPPPGVAIRPRSLPPRAVSPQPQNLAPRAAGTPVPATMTAATTESAPVTLDLGLTAHVQNARLPLVGSAIAPPSVMPRTGAAQAQVFRQEPGPHAVGTPAPAIIATSADKSASAASPATSHRDTAILPYAAAGPANSQQSDATPDKPVFTSRIQHLSVPEDAAENLPGQSPAAQPRPAASTIPAPEPVVTDTEPARPASVGIAAPSHPAQANAPTPLPAPADQGATASIAPPGQPPAQGPTQTAPIPEPAGVAPANAKTQIAPAHQPANTAAPPPAAKAAAPPSPDVPSANTIVALLPVQAPSPTDPAPHATPLPQAGAQTNPAKPATLAGLDQAAAQTDTLPPPQQTAVPAAPAMAAAPVAVSTQAGQKPSPPTGNAAARAPVAAAPAAAASAPRDAPAQARLPAKPTANAAPAGTTAFATAIISAAPAPAATAQPASAAPTPSIPQPAQPDPGAASQAAPPAAQLAQAVASLHVGADGTSHTTIRLDPAELGQLQIRISRAPDGTASVTIAVDRPETLSTLQGDLGHLHQALDRAGVSDQRNVSMHLASQPDQPSGTSSPGTGGFGTPQGGSQQGARQERHAFAAQPAPPPPAQPPSPTFSRPSAPSRAGVNITA